MLKALINECRFSLQLTAKSPLIIREGRLERDKNKEKTGKDEEKKTNPDNIPIRRGVFHKNEKDFQPQQDYYIPGTSLRGVLRSHMERIARTIAPGLCCDPLNQAEGQADQSCGSWLDNNKSKRKTDPGYLYAHSCVICRLFGSTAHASRIRVADSPQMNITANQVTTRDHIGIDRFTGGVRKGANFRDMVLENVTFSNQIIIRNFELWQLGLLAFVLKDLQCWQDGLVRLGYGKSKGYGLVEGLVNDLTIKYYGRPGGGSGTQGLTDLGNICRELVETYDFKPGTGAGENLLNQPEPGPYYTTWKIAAEQVPLFWQTAIRSWQAYLRPEAQAKFFPLAELRQAELEPGKDQTETK